MNIPASRFAHSSEECICDRGNAEVVEEDVCDDWIENLADYSIDWQHDDKESQTLMPKLSLFNQFAQNPIRKEPEEKVICTNVDGGIGPTEKTVDSDGDMGANSQMMEEESRPVPSSHSHENASVFSAELIMNQLDLLMINSEKQTRHAGILQQRAATLRQMMKDKEIENEALRTMYASLVEEYQYEFSKAYMGTPIPGLDFTLPGISESEQRIQAELSEMDFQKKVRRTIRLMEDQNAQKRMRDDRGQLCNQNVVEESLQMTQVLEACVNTMDEGIDEIKCLQVILKRSRQQEDALELPSNIKSSKRELFCPGTVVKASRFTAEHNNCQDPEISLTDRTPCEGLEPDFESKNDSKISSSTISERAETLLVESAFELGRLRKECNLSAMQFTENYDKIAVMEQKCRKHEEHLDLTDGLLVSCLQLLEGFIENIELALSCISQQKVRNKFVYDPLCNNNAQNPITGSDSQEGFEEITEENFRANNVKEVQTVDALVKTVGEDELQQTGNYHSAFIFKRAGDELDRPQKTDSLKIDVESDASIPESEEEVAETSIHNELLHLKCGIDISTLQDFDVIWKDYQVSQKEQDQNQRLRSACEAALKMTETFHEIIQSAEDSCNEHTQNVARLQQEAAELLEFDRQRTFQIQTLEADLDFWKLRCVDLEEYKAESSKTLSELMTETESKLSTLYSCLTELERGKTNLEGDFKSKIIDQELLHEKSKQEYERRKADEILALGEEIVLLKGCIQDKTFELDKKQIESEEIHAEILEKELQAKKSMDALSELQKTFDVTQNCISDLRDEFAKLVESGNRDTLLISQLQDTLKEVQSRSNTKHKFFDFGNKNFIENCLTVFLLVISLLLHGM